MTNRFCISSDDDKVRFESVHASVSGNSVFNFNINIVLDKDSDFSKVKELIKGVMEFQAKKSLEQLK